MSITETFREQLKETAISIDKHLNILLNISTTDQLKEAIEQHKHIQWENPSIRTKMVLDSITKKGNTWLFQFEFANIDFSCGPYLAHDLEIGEVLNFMATIENVLSPEPVLIN